MPNAPWYVPTVAARVKPTPWLSPEATSFLESLLFADMTVLEHGAGGSTLWFAERVQHVTAVEHDATWYTTLSKRIPKNVTLILGSGVLYVEPVDLLFIDGEPVENRSRWIESVSRLVKPGGYIVLDNANRPEYADAREALREIAKHIKTVNGNQGGCLYLITEFYQL